MIYMLDTANAEIIKKYYDLYPITGVTTNPTLISRENGNFLDILSKIREIISKDTMLHVQVLGITSKDIIKEANYLREIIGGNLYIKIPVTAQGIKTIKILSKQNFNITATAIFTPSQALLAATAGAKFLAPYINRTDSIGGSGTNLVKQIKQLLEISENTYSKILGASFKSVKQVNETMIAGAQSVTINGDLCKQLLAHPLTDIGITNFINDWENIYGKGKLTIDVK